MQVANVNQIRHLSHKEATYNAVVTQLRIISDIVQKDFGINKKRSHITVFCVFAST